MQICDGLKAPLHAFLQDLPGALDDAAVAEGLGLPQVKNRDWWAPLVQIVDSEVAGTSTACGHVVVSCVHSRLSAGRYSRPPPSKATVYSR